MPVLFNALLCINDLWYIKDDGALWIVGQTNGRKGSIDIIRNIILEISSPLIGCDLVFLKVLHNTERKVLVFVSLSAGTEIWSNLSGTIS